MTRYIVTGFTARFATGILSLNPDQAKRRAHNLQPLADGRFEIIHPVEFKAGEEFGYDGVVPKAMANELVDLETVRAEEKEEIPVTKAKQGHKAKPKHDDIR